MNGDLLADKMFTVSITGRTLNSAYEITIGTMFSSFDEACEGAQEMLEQIDKKRISGTKGTYAKNQIQGKERQKSDNTQPTREFVISSARLVYKNFRRIIPLPSGRGYRRRWRSHYSRINMLYYISKVTSKKSIIRCR